ncbi:MAG: proteasome activator [Acidimicrobiales bacterium]|jgi:hypothetical protein
MNDDPAVPAVPDNPAAATTTPAVSENPAEGEEAGTDSRPLVPIEISQPGAYEEEEFIAQPAKLMRIASMAKQLLEEVRMAPLDEASRTRMKEIYGESIRQLESTLSPELAQELDRLAIPFDDGAPTDAELRVAQGQLVGWLTGLFQGIQATLFVQQAATQRQLEQMRGVGPSKDSQAAIGDGGRTPYL